MRTWFAVVVALGFCLALAAPRTAGAATALGESKWSLEIGTWLGMGDGDNTIAIRRHSGASTAWRFGVEADLRKHDGDGTRTATGQPDTDIARFNESNDLAFTLHWMRFAPIRENLSVTFAVGPVIEHSTYTDRYDYSFDSQGENREILTQYGLDFGLGAEWFFTRRFSLGTQVGLRALAGTDKVISISRQDMGQPTYTKTESEIEADVTDLETSAGKILLSVYF